VVSTFVFCSVPDPVGGLRELRRVCKPDGRILLLEHVRIDRPVIGPLMDLLNHLTVRVAGEYINRRAVEDIGRADLTIDEIEDLGPMGIVKMMILKKPGNTEITGRN
ncbi:MAG TPA: methyltransferase domain-containing protein, partial [Syntrophales bacterium]|nr:methyltransferase domain-containing protein [Syntrophales bacterium]HOM08477.1 methyltransferase domain-containing protein [Syntrophales bacterium]HOO01046.1 methyltransferase domain-containing protein [Syntrophales bacterium]